jgi:hypothetical protein
MFPKLSRLALRPTQPAIQRYQGALSPGVKRLVREVDYAPVPKLRMCEVIPPFPIHIHGIRWEQRYVSKKKVEGSIFKGRQYYFGGQNYVRTSEECRP